jgi:hypothetical protein
MIFLKTSLRCGFSLVLGLRHATLSAGCIWMNGFVFMCRFGLDPAQKKPTMHSSAQGSVSAFTHR